MESVNPFLDKFDEYERINNSIGNYQAEIDAIKQKLQYQVDALIESRTNHTRALMAKANELAKSCTHLNAEGQPAIDKTHKDISSYIGDRLIKLSYCDICGKSFISSETSVAIPSLSGQIINGTIGYLSDDDEEFTETMEFDPDFDDKDLFF